MFNLTTDPFDTLRLWKGEGTYFDLPTMRVPLEVQERWRASRFDVVGLVQEWFQEFGPGTEASLFDQEDMRAALNRTKNNQSHYFVEAAVAVAFWTNFRIRSIGETLRRNRNCELKAAVLDQILSPELAEAIRGQAFSHINERGERYGGEPDLLLYRDDEWVWCEVKRRRERPTESQVVYNPRLVAATGKPVLVQRVVIR